CETGGRSAGSSSAAAGGCGSGSGVGAGGCGSGSGGPGCGSGEGVGGVGVSTPVSSQLGTCSTVRSSGSAGASGAAVAASSGGGCSASPRCSACFCAASVARNSSASGPSRMLARRRAIEHLLRQVTVHRSALAARVVLEDRLPLHRRLRVTHRLADLRVEDEIAEVLLQDLDRLARVEEPPIEHRRDDAL